MRIQRPLSERQLEVLRLVCAGFASTEVADLLGVSEGTVRAKRRTVYQKLRVTNQADACRELERILGSVES